MTETVPVISGRCDPVGGVIRNSQCDRRRGLQCQFDTNKPNPFHDIGRSPRVILDIQNEASQCHLGHLQTKVLYIIHLKGPLNVMDQVSNSEVEVEIGLAACN